jgi:hypothetical protein
MADAADLSDEVNWSGGLYGISLDFGPDDDDGLAAAVEAVWGTVPVNGCWAREPHNPLAFLTASPHLSSLEDGGLYGSMHLSVLGEVVCGVYLHRREAGAQLEVVAPIGALERLEPRIGGFPFGEDSGPASLTWRAPIDRWFADWAVLLHGKAPFRRGAIGFEVPTPDEVEANVEYFGRLLPGDAGVAYVEAVR